MKAIIIDDERPSREALAQKIRLHCPEIELGSLCSGAVEGWEAVRTEKPDLVFLDIEMPIYNGFDFLEKVQSHPFQVIFTTAYNEYAIQAIRYSALDYLVKPVDVEELKSALERARKHQKESQTLQLQTLMRNLKAGNTLQSLAISTAEGLYVTHLSEILYLQADGNYTHIGLSTGKILSSKPLGEFEEALPADRFFRVHHSAIIHLEHIRKYIRGEGGEVVMTDQTHLPVARRRKEELLERIKAFAGKV
jgi:two-component system LytT family response regulator